MVEAVECPSCAAGDAEVIQHGEGAEAHAAAAANRREPTSETGGARCRNTLWDRQTVSDRKWMPIGP